MSSNKRVPVLDPEGKPLMPTMASRARRWIRNGKACVVPNERFSSRTRKMHDLTLKKGGVRDTYGGFDGTHSFGNGNYVQYQTNNCCLNGFISANDLYQFFPQKKRLKQGVTDKNTRRLLRSTNLLANSPLHPIALRAAESDGMERRAGTMPSATNAVGKGVGG